MRRAAFRVGATVWAVALVSSSVAAFWPVYGTSAFVAMAVGAIGSGTAVAVCSAWRHGNAALTTGVAAVVFVLLGVPLAVPGEAVWAVLPSLQGLLDLVTTTALGWRQLTTIAIPVGSTDSLLVPAYVMAFGAATSTVTLALRSRTPELAVVPPLVVFAVAILFGSDTTATPIPLVVAIAALAVGWLAMTRRARRRARLASLASAQGIDAAPEAGSRSAVVRSTVVTIAALAVTLAAGLVVATVLPATAERTVVRTAAEPAFDPQSYPSPLSAFRSYLERPAASTVQFTASGLGDVPRLSIATLDTYNGVVYAVGDRAQGSGTFSRVPDTLVAPTASASRPTQTITVTVGALSGPWLPTFGALENVSFTGAEADSLADGFYYNSATTTMVETVSDLAGARYRLTAEPTPSLTISQLAGAAPGHAALPAVTGMPSQVAPTVLHDQGHSTNPGTRLKSALAKLAATGYVSHGIGAEPKSLSGHGADRIDALLSADPMIGDQEQYAVTAALMARQIGFPARVVLGFDVPQHTGDATVSFTGADIDAWIQVQTAKDGWVDVDPNPAVRPIPAAEHEQSKKVSRPQTVVPPQNDQVQQVQQSAPRTDQKKQAEQHTPAWLAALLTVATVLGWIVLCLALVIAPFLAVIGAKRRRRRVRRSVRATPRARIAGAWLEFADVAADHGYRASASATRSELARVVGGPLPLLLASVADRSAFGVADPTSHDADQVWRAVEELYGDLDARTGRWGRWRARLSLRSFAGYGLAGYRGRGTVSRRSDRRSIRRRDGRRASDDEGEGGDRGELRSV